MLTIEYALVNEYIIPHEDLNMTEKSLKSDLSIEMTARCWCKDCEITTTVSGDFYCIFYISFSSIKNR